jgi:hypothetical protein
MHVHGDKTYKTLCGLKRRRATHAIHAVQYDWVRATLGLFACQQCENHPLVALTALKYTNL